MKGGNRMIDHLFMIEKERLPEMAENLQPEDIKELVGLLSEKADDLRYQSLLLLQYRSRIKSDVYPYWEVFGEKLKSDNSYQRNIGLTLIAENARWDTGNQITSTLDEYLLILKDEKPITVRLCIQSLKNIIPYHPELCQKIAESLLQLELLEIRETMRKLVLMDILEVLVLIKKFYNTTEIQTYISNAMTGEILDKKSKKQMEAFL
jgi:hypothetical protein